MRYGQQHLILWSDTFSLYPWTLDKEYEHVVAQTPALMSIHLVEEFRGQSVPELPSRLTLERFCIDTPLLEILIERWRRCYMTTAPHADDVKLFRSLNMANQAARMPAGRDATFYDVGPSIALWVSAFEILAHSGKGGRSGPSEVIKLLNNINWLSPRLKARRFLANTRGIRDTFPTWLYGLINRARNDFLHGNPATVRNLKIARSGKSIFVYAAPLYRMALAAFLGVVWSEEAPDTADGGAQLGEWMAQRWEFESPQQLVESGLLTALKKIANEEDD